MITQNDHIAAFNLTAFLSQKTAVHSRLHVAAAKQWIRIPLSFVSCNLLPHCERNWSGYVSNGPPFCPLSPTDSTQKRLKQPNSLNPIWWLMNQPNQFYRILQHKTWADNISLEGKVCPDLINAELGQSFGIFVGMWPQWTALTQHSAHICKVFHLSLPISL